MSKVVTDLLGNPLKMVEEKEEDDDTLLIEPPYTSDIVQEIEKYQDMIHVIVKRSGKKVDRILSKCKPKEVIRYMTRCVVRGIPPTTVRLGRK